ncbi:hypothetical protein [Sporosalibacterium faouarense]|uniref:hypothetical protein n=1 Tax=Sporosalibacterium faouarense TaxID=516123 RepID=UPI00141D2AE4|nr:hypothetical protein [Sporosalibacterium faouarense]MTI49566.1 hypothetical protein [Bacillota bacterium]
MKKVFSLLIIFALIFGSMVPSFAITYEELPDWADEGDIETISNTYTYNQVKEIKLDLKGCRSDIADAIDGGVTDSGTIIGLVAKAMPTQVVSSAGDKILILSALLLLDRAIGVQRIYSDIDDDYEYYNDLLDEMDPGDTVTISQEFEFRKIKLWGDFFWAWYANGPREYTIN